MRRKIILIYISSFILSGCSSIIKGNDSLQTTIIMLDSVSIDAFSRRIHTKHPDYGEISRPNDGNIGPDGDNISTILMIDRADICEMILYSYDRQDSCVIFSDSLVRGNYTIPHKSIRVPEGYYILKYGGESIVYLTPASPVAPRKTE